MNLSMIPSAYRSKSGRIKYQYSSDLSRRIEYNLSVLNFAVCLIGQAQGVPLRLALAWSEAYQLVQPYAVKVPGTDDKTEWCEPVSNED